MRGHHVATPNLLNNWQLLGPFDLEDWIDLQPFSYVVFLTYIKLLEIHTNTFERFSKQGYSLVGVENISSVPVLIDKLHMTHIPYSWFFEVCKFHKFCGC